MDPNGIGNSSSNNNSNNSNGDINGTETVASGVGDEEARRHGNTSGDGKRHFFYFSVLCSVQYNNVYRVTCSFLAEGAYSRLIPGNHCRNSCRGIKRA